MNSRPFPISFDHRKWGPSMIAGTYLLIGALWILFSDQFAARIAPNQIVLTQISIYKGWGYVLVTALLLYWLILRHTGRVSAIDRNYRLISENASDVIWILDPARGKFKYVSPSVQKLRGYTPEEVMAQPMMNALTSDSLERINILTATRIFQFQAQGSGTASYIDEVDQPRKDGSVVNTEVTTTYLFNEQGGIEIVGVSRDISERKQAMRKLSESEQNYQELLEQASDGIFIADSNGQYTIVNEEACRLVGYTREELLSMKIQDMVAPEDLEKTPLRFDELRDGKTLITERKFVHKNGSWILCEISAKMLPDGRFQSIVRDITERKVTGEALVKSEKRYRSLFENMTNGFARCQMLYDNGKPSDFIYLDVNNAFKNLTGLKDVIGRRVTEIVPGIRESNPELFEIYGRVASTRKPERFETYVPELKSGIWFSVSVYSPEKGFFVAVFETITERKRTEETLREERDRFSKVVSTVPGLICSFRLCPDGSTCMPYASPSIEEVYGLREVDVVDDASPIFARIHPEDLAQVNKTIERSAQTMSPWQDEYRYQHPKKGEIWLEGRSVPIREADGSITWHGFIYDISDRKEAENIIHHTNENLEQRVHERTMQLQNANKELEAFSYSVSHDLRAPLRAIDGYTHILMEDYEPILSEEGKRICNIISSETQRMGRLIDDLLTFSRLSRKELNSTKIDMQAVASSVFSELAKEENIERIDLQMGKLPSTRGDQALMRQVWVNLLANAIKFTSGKKRAVIEVGSTKNKHETVYYVRDNGAGFDMEYADKLFGVFQRLHSESEFEGTGVGLAIVQRVIHRHGGRVWAEGKVDEGAVFYFALPQKGEKQWTN